MTENGKPLSDALGSAVQGSPAEAVAWLANTLGACGVTLEAGDVTLSNSLVQFERVEPSGNFGAYRKAGALRRSFCLGSFR